ncbi:MAG: penicillin-binding protein 2 [Myxococcales bacterium]|nr:penicillin-binding protein 2 [Myxococcales bacterium]
MIMLSQRREVGEFRKRYKWMALFAIVVFGILFGRLIQLQLLQHDQWSAEAIDNITKTISLPASRGVLRDANGEIVATNRPSYDVFITPQLLIPERDIPLMIELMGLDEEQAQAFMRRLHDVPPPRRTHQIRMFTDITRDQVAAIETHGVELRGVDVVAVPLRTYPFGSLASHAVGYLNEVSAEDIARHPEQGYRAGDRLGRTGIEKHWESYLRGRRGYRRILVDARGRRQRDREGLAATRETVLEPVPGQDFSLSLDMQLMRTIQRAFRGHPSGAAVVVDVRTGQVRALYSKPSYDINEFTAGFSSRRWNELLENPFRPLLDKTVYESYFPGSTFKPISALAALQDGILDPAHRVECIGYYEIGNDRKGCTSVHGDVDMHSAIVQSCNVYFYRLAEEVGLERLNRYAREFGLGRRTGIGINTESRGFLADRQWYEDHFGRYRVGYTLNTAIGQGNTRTTLLQLALAYGAMANGGTLHAPLLVQGIHGADGTLLEEFPPRVRRRLAIDPEHLDYVLRGMRGVVNEPNGTAYDARIAGGVTIAGKTGTAEVQPGGRRHPDPRRAWYFNKSHAWFAGFAPADDPEVAIVVIVEHGGGGGRIAAPIAVRILQEHLGSRSPTASASAAERSH